VVVDESVDLTDEGAELIAGRTCLIGIELGDYLIDLVNQPGTLVTATVPGKEPEKPVTYTKAPFGLMATKPRNPPTSTVSVTALFAVSITLTVPSPKFAT